MNILNCNLFSTWIFLAFVLFYCNLSIFNPIILLYIALILVIICAIAIYINTDDIIYFYFFVFINIIIKIIPIYLIKDRKITSYDYLLSILIFVIYLLFIHNIKEKHLFNIYYKLYQSYVTPRMHDKNDNTLNYLKDICTNFYTMTPRDDENDSSRIVPNENTNI